MHILQAQRQGALAAVFRARLAHRARGRVGPERFVIRSTIVIAGQPEPSWRPKDENGRREDQPRGPPGRFRPEPAVRRGPEQLGRIERREIRPIGVVGALQRRPGRVDDEGAEPDKDQQRLQPPRIAARGPWMDRCLVVAPAMVGRLTCALRHTGPSGDFAGHGCFASAHKKARPLRVGQQGRR